MSKHFYKLKVKKIIRETAQTISIVFDVPADLHQEFSYRAGQYLTLKANIKGEEVRRSYSLSSCPSDGEWKVSSKTVPNGKMSTYLDQELKEGMEMEVMPPEGRFTTEDIPAPSQLILFAAGSGITPIISILKFSLREDAQNKVTLFYGNSTEEDIIFKQELSDLENEYMERLKVHHILSQANNSSPEFEGRISEDKISFLLKDFNNLADLDYFICGPEGMIAATKAGLEKLEVPSDKINIEYFASPKTTAEEKVQEVISGDVSDVKVILDDEEHEISLKPNETILEAAERIGIDPPFSCQSGVCTTCQAKVLQGNVEMENNFGLGEDEVEEGYVLTCISKPTTPGVIVSWDEV